MEKKENDRKERKVVSISAFWPFCPKSHSGTDNMDIDTPYGPLGYYFRDVKHLVSDILSRDASRDINIMAK